ncbi:MAG TPA: hypothetical protein VGT24_06320 [Candidatus Acidoferrales bacterium]|nr:hypothetical protein [Candidatus Acidoferrales bacterium]
MLSTDHNIGDLKHTAFLAGFSSNLPANDLNILGALVVQDKQLWELVQKNLKSDERFPNRVLYDTVAGLSEAARSDLRTRVKERFKEEFGAEPS